MASGGRKEDYAFFERQFHRFLTPEIPRTAKKLVFGRQESKTKTQAQADAVTFVTCSSEFVSRKHAEVFCQEGAYYICDLGSLNGTYLNNLKLTPHIPHRLQISDRIGLGMSEDNAEFSSRDTSFFIFSFRQSQRQVFETIEIVDSDEEEEPTRQGQGRQGNRSNNVLPEEPIEVLPPPVRVKSPVPEIICVTPEPEIPPVPPPRVPSPIMTPADISPPAPIPPGNVKPGPRATRSTVPEEIVVPPKANKAGPKRSKKENKDEDLPAKLTNSVKKKTDELLNGAIPTPAAAGPSRDQNKRTDFNGNRTVKKASSEIVETTSTHSELKAGLKRKASSTEIEIEKSKKRGKQRAPSDVEEDEDLEEGELSSRQKNQSKENDSSNSSKNAAGDRNGIKAGKTDPPATVDKDKLRKDEKVKKTDNDNHPVGKMSNFEPPKDPATSSATNSNSKKGSKLGKPDPKGDDVTPTVAVVNNAKLSKSVKLRVKQLIRVVNGKPAIRKKILKELNRLNQTSKVYRQWTDSFQRHQRLKRTHQSDDESNFDSDDSDNSDMFEQIKTVTSKEHKANKEKGKETASTSTSKSKSNKTKQSPPKEKTYHRVSVKASDSESDPPEGKRPRIAEQKNSRERNSSVSSSASETNQNEYSYSQHIESVRSPETSPVVYSPGPEPTEDDHQHQHGIGHRDSFDDFPTADSISDGELTPDDEPADKHDGKSPSPPQGKEKAGSSRRAIMLPDALPPRHVQRRQEQSLQRARMDAKINAKSTTVEKTNKLPSASIRDKLRDVAAAHASKPPNYSKTGTHTTAPVRTKVTGSNRNDQLIASMMANQPPPPPQKPETRSSSKDKGQTNNSTTPELEIIIEPSLSAPRREIPPLPSPATQAKMPVNAIMTAMAPPAPARGTRVARTKSPPKATASTSASASTSSRPLARVNPMEKPGVTQARERDNKIVVDYHHKDATYRPVGAGAGAKQQSAAFSAILPEDEVHRSILSWNSIWLKEQKKVKAPPPVVGNREIVGTLSEYVDYKSYIDVFFPLILLEIWATISQDYEDKRKSSRSRNEGITEFPISVDQCTLTNVCPMVNQSWASHASNEGPGVYTIVTCHTLARSRHEINNRRDLALVTLGIKGRQGKEDETHEYFAFVLFPDTVVPLDAGSIVNPKLKEKIPNATFRVSFQLVITSKFTVKKGYIGKLQRICYISSKLRDVKAMVQLPFSKLFDKVINAQPPRIAWNPQTIVLPNQMIQHVAKLNPNQKTAVMYCSDLVLKSTDPELVLIHGPPGTGKTKTIVGMVLQILMSKDLPKFLGKRILLCTPSNTAIDEIMLRLEEAIKDLPNNGAAYLDKLRMIRVGDTDNKLLRKYTVDEQIRRLEAEESTNKSIRKTIEQCKTDITARKYSIEELKKAKASKTRIESLEKELKELKERHQSYTDDLNKNMADKGQSSQKKRKVLEQANIVCSTLNSCSQSLLTHAFGSLQSTKPKPFLCCIVDEASQTTEPETLAPLLLQIDKLILVGDPHQLGATVLSKEAESKRLGDSLFSRLYNQYNRQPRPGSVVMLTQQYRMHPEILHWPNEFFYKGLLKTQCLGRSSEDACPLRPYSFLNLSSKENSDREGHFSNEEEKKVVVNIIHTIKMFFQGSSSSKQDWTIGVITPYSTQKASIANEIRTELPELSATIEVDTVDSFQGREKDIIIISCVRTDDTGFLKNAKRLNVALTRAKHSLIIVGDAKCLKKDSMWKSLIENSRERGCFQDLSTVDISVPTFLRKKIFPALSPTKASLPD